MAAALDTPIQYLKGVGPKRARIFEKAGIATAEDLLRHRPFRYEDRTRFSQIRQLELGSEAVIKAEVAAVGSKHTRRRLSIIEMIVRDESGILPVKFFNQPYLEKTLAAGQHMILYGTIRRDSYTGQLGMSNPEFELLEADTDLTVHTGRIVPVYRRIQKIHTRLLRQIIFRLLEALSSPLEDPLPETLQKKLRLPGRLEAFRELHFPSQPAAKAKAEVFLAQLEALQTPAQRRFVFEEFFFFQLGLLLLRERRKRTEKTHRVELDDRAREAVKAILPFHPTDAQKRVLGEIAADLAAPTVMNRLLQGDVGSGKTIVALQAAVVVMVAGLQAALMAPTEILAEQHYRSVSRLFEDQPYRVALLTGAVRGAARRQLLQQLEAGEIDLLIGTHAVIQKGVRFRHLALSIIDEQHRFGVMQRFEMMEKGPHPDTLVMTATPIPRSLALTVYGDLDLSVLDELPPGRQPIRTVIKNESSREEVYELIRKQLEAGRQAYIVYPLVEESEKTELRAATRMAEQLQEGPFARWKVGLVHGRLKSEEKDQLMQGFERGEIHVLVATTVIEVGVDVPNAATMVIEHADRFGLSQLHQLRGRIGRGEHASVCVLLVDRVRSREAYERLDIMRRTNDGFKIAERDLEIRGPGEFVGTRQSGVPEFHFGNIVRDRAVLELARTEAILYLKEAQGSKDGLQYLGKVAEEWKKRFRLYEVG